MECVKYLFLIFISAGCTSIGFLASKKYNNRVQELKDFSMLINILQNKIKFTHKPLQEIFEEISKIETDNTIPNIFFEAGRNLNNKQLFEAWGVAIEEARFYLNLKKEDLDLIKTLGNMLRENEYRRRIERNRRIQIYDKKSN